MLRVSELRMRDVVNVIDGRRLGTIKDFDLDVEMGRIKAVILPGSGRFLGLFGRNDDVVIPWEKIVKVGIDVILVELQSFTEARHRTGDDPEILV
ncbi:MAG: YlmC/YmxH family sporulation protein [Firmicutes bacterium]|nr:YlmC/YmxH family sporulation protein [Bacillota bacterium]